MPSCVCVSACVCVCVRPCTGTPCPCGGMKCIFSGTSIEMPGNDALRLAMV